MSNYSRVNVKFGADISEFSTAMQNAAREMTKASQQLTSVGMSMTRNLTLPIVALGSASLYAFGKIDTLKRGLISVMGTAGQANKEFSDLVEIAKLPGLGLEEVTRADVNLQAIGLTSEYAKKSISELGNAIATVGGGRENFDLAIRGFGQLANASKPLQQDLYQIANQVPQINKILIETFGTNRAEDLADMGMSGRQLADVLIEKLGKLQRATGGNSNAFENMSDSIKISLSTIGESIDTNLGITDKINSFGTWIGELAKGFADLQPWVQKTILGVGLLVAAIGPLTLALGAIVSVWPTVIAGFAALKTAAMSLTVLFSPLALQIGAVVLAVGLLASAGAVLYQNWQAITDRLSNIFLSMTKFILGKLKTLVGGLDKVFSYFGVNAFGTLEASIDGLINGLPSAKDAKGFKSFGDSISDTADEIGNKLKSMLFKPETNVKAETATNKVVKKVTPPQDPAAAKAADKAAEEAWKNNDKAQNEIALRIAQNDSIARSLQARNEDINEVQGNGFKNMIISTRDGWDGINEAQDKGGNTWMQKWSKLTTDSRAKFEAFNAQLKDILQQGVIDLLTETFAKIGENIAMGGNPFKDIGKNMLQSLGSFMQKLGSAFITLGVTTVIAEDSIISGNPYAAIAAGAAMVAAGAAISSIQKKGIQKQDSGGSYGGSSYAGGRSGGEDLTLYTRLDGRDLVLSGQRTQAVGRR